MKKKTANLIGFDLDLAVAKCENNGQNCFEPSTRWQLGGPILERKGISSVRCYNNGIPNKGEDSWRADLPFKNGVLTLGVFTQYGPTMLIAGMRCYVCSEMGEEL